MTTPLQIDSYACQKCGWIDFHPAQVCPRCSRSTRKTTLPGKGRVVSFTTIRYPPKGFEAQAPYLVAIIDIESGPRVIGRVTDSGNEVEIGADVVLKSRTDGRLEFQLSP